MPASPPNYRHERYKLLLTPGDIDGEMIRLTRILHRTESLAMRDVIREDQDYLLDLRNKRVRKTKRGTRVPRLPAA